MNEADANGVRLTLGDVKRLARRSLRVWNKRGERRSVARSIASAEAAGLASHGLTRLPAYCEHVECGKVDGRADPAASSGRAGAWRVDARHGFAHLAIDLGFRHLAPAARQDRIASLSVTRSYNCGVLGYHVERLARQGLIAIAGVVSSNDVKPLETGK